MEVRTAVKHNHSNKNEPFQDFISSNFMTLPKLNLNNPNHHLQVKYLQK